MGKMSPLGIMNLMGKAAHQKAQPKPSPDSDTDADDSLYSKPAQNAIGNKMHKMAGEDRPQKQKVAIAMSEARSKGLKVPGPK